MSNKPSILSVHAHPDDEASKGSATVARYSKQGVHTVLVCCTGGEEGDILNPAMDTSDVRANLAEIRLEELRRSAKIIGYNEVVMLGYRDSGMPDSPANKDPRSFAAAPVQEATAALVKVIRRTKPQVIITYDRNSSGYLHPDHLKVHDISVAGFHASGDPDLFPDSGPPWQPAKLYYTVWSAKRVQALHEKLLANGHQSPFNESWLSRLTPADDITTVIDISKEWDVRFEALRAHATQIDPNSGFWAVLNSDLARQAYPYDDYILAMSRVGFSKDETDLFERVTMLSQ
ncbi:MAG: mycothiol conjugate amidase Mca [Actinobacteria bacterium]|nr:mycothiol conjugate amidase Mca [Actinomycetota bacterium]